VRHSVVMVSSPGVRPPAAAAAPAAVEADTPEHEELKALLFVLPAGPSTTRAAGIGGGIGEGVRCTDTRGRVHCILSTKL